MLLCDALGEKVQLCIDADTALTAIGAQLEAGDCWVFMSNGDMQGLQRRVVEALDLTV